MKTSNEKFKLVLDVRRDWIVNGSEIYTVENLPGTLPSYSSKSEAEDAAQKFYKRTGVFLYVQPFFSVSI